MFCEYGCGQEAKYQFKNGKWCCSIHHRKCPANINKLILCHKGKKRSTESIDKMKKSQALRSNRVKKEKENKIKKDEELIGIEKCFYCGERSKYYSKTTGKYCCSYYRKCPGYRELQKNSANAKFIITEQRCTFCGNEASYVFKNGSFCCSKRLQSCPVIKRKNAISNSFKQKGENNAMFGRHHTIESKRKNRLSNISYLFKHVGQIAPNYNKRGCILIEEYGKQHGYNFQHAENGGEFFIKKLGYWVDGYDKENNVVIEVDEKHHFDVYGNLKEKDKQRQKEIEEFLGCEFIRIKDF